MATLLQRQLAAISGPAGAHNRRQPKREPSLLFDEATAADTGSDAIRDGAAAGLEKLEQLDARFAAFADPLFSAASLAVDRSQNSSAENAELDSRLLRFMQLLAPHFLSDEASLTLEYLIRQYKLQIYNVSSVLAILLPFHSTAKFARLVKICELDGTVWKFLQGMQSTGATLPRAALAKFCAADHALLSTVYDAVAACHSNGTLTQLHASFYAVLVCDVLRARTPSQGLLRLLLAQMAPGLRRGASQHLRAACILVLACVFTDVPVATPMRVAIARDICATMGDEAADVRGSLLLLTHAHDTHVAAPGGGGVNVLVEGLRAAGPLREVVVEIAEMQAQGLRTGALVCACVDLLLEATCGASTGAQGGTVQQPPLEEVIDTLDMEPIAAELTERVLQALKRTVAQRGSRRSKGGAQVPAADAARAGLARAVCAIHRQQAEVVATALKSLKAAASGSTDARVLNIVAAAMKADAPGHAPAPSGPGGKVAAVVAGLRRRVAADACPVVSALGAPGSVHAKSLQDLAHQLELLHGHEQQLLAELPRQQLQAYLTLLIRGLRPQAAGVHAGWRDAACRVLMAAFSLVVRVAVDAADAVDVLLSLMAYLLPGRALKSVRRAAWRLVTDLPVDEPFASALRAVQSWRSETAGAGAAAGEPGGDTQDIVEEASRTAAAEEPVCVSERRKHATRQSGSKSKRASAEGEGGSARSALLIFVKALASSVQQQGAQEALLRLLEGGGQVAEHVLLMIVVQLLRAGQPDAWVVSAASRSLLLVCRRGSVVDAEAVQHVGWLQKLADDRSQVGAFLVGHLNMLSRTDLPAAHDALSLHAGLLALRCGRADDAASGCSDGEVLREVLRVRPAAAVQGLLPAVLARCEVDPAARQSLRLVRVLGDAVCEGGFHGHQQGDADTALAALHALLVWLRVPTQEGEDGGGTPAATRPVEVLLEAAPIVFGTLAAGSRGLRAVALPAVKGLAGELAAGVSRSTLPPLRCAAEAAVQVAAVIADNSDSVLASGEVLGTLLEHLAGLEAVDAPPEADGQGSTVPAAVFVFVSHLFQWVLADTPARTSVHALAALLPAGVTAAAGGHTHLVEEAATVLRHLAKHAEVLGGCGQRGDVLAATAAVMSVCTAADEVGGASGLPLEALSAVLATGSLQRPAAAVELLVHSRLQALERFSGSVFGAAPWAVQREAVQQLLFCASSDPQSACRQAAEACLQGLPLATAHIAPTLDAFVQLVRASEQGEQPTGKRASPEGRHGLDAQQVEPALEALLALLAMLQWREGIGSVEELVEPLQACTTCAHEVLAALDSEAAEADGAHGDESALRSRLLHARRLCVSALCHVAQCVPTAALQLLDLKAMLLVAEESGEAAVQTSALKLVTAAASKAPQVALDCVLKTVAFVSVAQVTQVHNVRTEDTWARALQAVAEAWLGEGGDARQLFRAVLRMLGAVRASHRYSLLLSLSRAGPPQQCLQALAEVALAAAGAGGDSGGDDEQAAEVEADENAEGAGGDAGGSLGLLPLLARVFDQAAAGDQLAALAGLLQMRLLSRKGHIRRRAEAVLQFACERVGAKGVQKGSAKGGAPADALLAVLLQLLPHLHTLQQERRRVPRVQRAQETVQRVLGAVQQAAGERLFVSLLARAAAESDGALRLAALQQLPGAAASMQSQGKKARRRQRGGRGRVRCREPDDLKAVVGDCLATVTAIAKGDSTMATAEAHDDAGGDGADVRAATSAAAAAAIGVLATFVPPGAAALQAQLGAAVPALLVHLQEGGAGAGAALKALGRVAAAMRDELIPHVPTVLPALLAAAAAALPQVAAADGGGADKQESPTDVLEAATTALCACVSWLPGLLSPYLPGLLDLAVDGRLLSHADAPPKTRLAAVVAAAAELQSQLAQRLEARVLLPAIAQKLHAAESQGTAVVVALLHMLARASGRMSAEEAAERHNGVVTCLLDVLSLRSRASEGADIDADVCEQAARQVLLAVVLKLSERLFKPLFLRLVSWGTAMPAHAANLPAADQRLAVTARTRTFFSVINALATTMRSIFTPYFHHVLQPLLAALGAQDAAGGVEAAAEDKKRKKARVAGKRGAQSIPAAVAPAVQSLALQCLFRCALHDMHGFLNTERFQSVLEVLLHQLACLEAKDVGAPADSDVLQSIELAVGSWLPQQGVALVATFVQLALVTKDEALRRRLNHEVLMVTRSERAVSRLAAVEVVYNVVARLREEFLLLLPESLPFVAELMEDGDAAVKRRTQDTIHLLEQLSDEKLDDYLMV